MFGGAQLVCMDEDIQDLYLKKDLTDYSELPTEVDGYTRTDYIKAILPEKATIDAHSVGSYQGTMGIVIGLDGYYWLIKEHYGSCSYCDGMLGAESKIEYAESILRNAYCLPDEETALRFLACKEEESSYGWNDITPEMREIVREMPVE